MLVLLRGGHGEVMALLRDSGMESANPVSLSLVVYRIAVLDPQ